MARFKEPRDAQFELEKVMEAADDRGMEMLARVFVIGAATVVVLTTLYLLWPGLERLVGGLS